MKILFNLYYTLIYHFFNYLRFYMVLLPIIFTISFNIIIFNLHIVYCDHLNPVTESISDNKLKDLWTPHLKDYLYKQTLKKTDIINDLSTVKININKDFYIFPTSYFIKYIRSEASIKAFIENINWDDFYHNYITDASNNKVIFFNKITNDYLLYMKKSMIVYYDLITPDVLLEAKEKGRHHLNLFSQIPNKEIKMLFIEKILDIIPWDNYIKTYAFQTGDYSFLEYLYKKSEKEHNTIITLTGFNFKENMPAINSILKITTISLLFVGGCYIIIISPTWAIDLYADEFIITEGARISMENMYQNIKIASIRFGPIIVEYIKSFF